MPSIKDLKKRIGTVKNTQQTTRAMKMVSAAKLRRAQDSIYAHRPYSRGVRTLIRLVARMPDGVGGEFYQRVMGRTDVEGPRRALAIVVSSDRGLCGGLNTNLLKASLLKMKECKEVWHKIIVLVCWENLNNCILTLKMR